MSGVQEKKIPQFIYTDQINYPNHVRLFVLSVFLLRFWIMCYLLLSIPLVQMSLPHGRPLLLHYYSFFTQSVTFH